MQDGDPGAVSLKRGEVGPGPGGVPVPVVQHQHRTPVGVGVEYGGQGGAQDVQTLLRHGPTGEGDHPLPVVG
jgi:hypothetical protein